MKLTLDAEALYRDLVRGVQQFVQQSGAEQARLVGVVSGGAWLAERLQKDLKLAGNPGAISSLPTSPARFRFT